MANTNNTDTDPRNAALVELAKRAGHVLTQIDLYPEHLDLEVARRSHSGFVSKLQLLDVPEVSDELFADALFAINVLAESIGAEVL